MQELIQKLTSIVGPDHVHAGDDVHKFSVSGATPKAAVFPATPEEVAGVLALAGANGLAVIPLGGQTQADLGERPRAYDIALVLTRLDRVVSYEPDDMTVTVQAGMTLDRLQEVLAAGNQFLPVDPPLPKEATVGGAVATRAFGPLRLGFRTIADRLLGIKVVTAAGEIAKAGGRVVKNVSGYEMGRLYTGSFGTLAVITEVTFKAQPQFELREMLIVEVGDLGTADRYIKEIVHSDALPVLMELVGPRSARDGEFEQFAAGTAELDAFGGDGEAAFLVLGYGGTRESIDWQIEEALRIMRRVTPTKTLSFRRAPWDPVHGLLLDLHGRKAQDGAVLRIHVPDDVLVPRIQEALRLARSSGLGMRYAAHAGSGAARLAFSLADRLETEGADLARELRTLAERDGGNLIVERAPQGFREIVGVWGEPRSDFFLHRAVKEKMDPKGILSPGRFIGGL